MSDYMTSIIRTVVPSLVGLLVSYLATKGITVTDGQAAELATVLAFSVGALYYIVVRALEHKWPQLGWLLGSPKAPTYGA